MRCTWHRPVDRSGQRWLNKVSIRLHIQYTPVRGMVWNMICTCLRVSSFLLKHGSHANIQAPDSFLQDQGVLSRLEHPQRHCAAKKSIEADQHESKSIILRSTFQTVGLAQVRCQIPHAASTEDLPRPREL